MTLREKLQGKSNAAKLVIAFTFVALHPIYSFRVFQDMVRKIN
jgi:hypothetical protein